MLNIENLFLIVLGLIWIIGAVIQDLKKREVDNIWNFSLIAFALAYRGFVSIWGGNYWFILNGLIGLIIFFALGNLFYYSRLFAGGDAKLLMALGTVLPFSYEWMINFKIFGLFIFLFLITGSVYALFYALILVFKNWKNFKKEFLKQWKHYQKMFLISLIFVIIWVNIIYFMSQIRFILIGFVILLFPILYVFSKSVEETCMVKSVSPKKATQGDWLYGDVRIGKKKIKADWQGLSKRELNLIRKSKKKVLIKYGIPFTPAFLFAFVILLYLMYGIKWIF
jgi:Flp pilus assembly protein protease CpaA